MRGALACLARTVFSGARAYASEVAWVDWTAADSASVFGTTTVGGSTVAVTSTGERGFVQTTCGTNYWVATTATNPYASAAIDNPPDVTPDTSKRCDIIALNLTTAQSLSFSEPITNPLSAVVSLNGNGNPFDREFTILSTGRGYWGNGTPSKRITNNSDGSITYDLRA